jgi:dTDP-3-amino-3,4,6-trideoxy-alpha-D-glucose transaminase
MAITAPPQPIPLNDTRPQYAQIKEAVQAAITRVLERSYFILGEEVSAFEQEFAAYLGVKHAIGVSNGTDAIHIAMRALGIGPGDEVLIPPHTATFSALGVSMAGATPVFADCELGTGNLDPWLVTKAITSRTKAIMPVHLYGQAADMDMMLQTAAERGIPLVEDAAQAHGATYHDRRVGTLGAIGCFSFYPTKNLGAYGDGGAVVTNDDDLAARMRQLRNGGQADRYHHVVQGFCNRLDELQAAILRVKLPYLDGWNAARAERAAYYTRKFDQAGSPVRPISTRSYGQPAYHLYVIRTPDGTRDGLQAYLKEAGISTMIHYPIPVHLQEAYAGLGLGPGAYPDAELLARTVLSLPLYPELAFADMDRVVKAVTDFYS